MITLDPVYADFVPSLDALEQYPSASPAIRYIGVAPNAWTGLLSLNIDHNPKPSLCRFQSILSALEQYPPASPKIR